jgi:hypothetical protein
MAVGFLSSIRTERLASRSYMGSIQARLIADAAIEVVKRKISEGIRNNDAFIITLENQVPTDSDYSPIPCISYENGNVTTNVRLVSSTAGDPWQERKAASAAEMNTAHGLIQQRSTITSGDKAKHYRVPWENLETMQATNTTKSGRYAYLILDEQARLNPRYHKGTDRGLLPDQWTEDTSTVSLYTGSPALLTNTEKIGIGNITQSLITPFTIGQGVLTQERVNQTKHLLSSHKAKGEEIIPYGYPDAGKPRYNINELATNVTYGASDILRAENIARIIDLNLPQFKSRDPSLPTTNQINYLNRLAASIVDYIDTDTVCTTANNGEPAGRDLFPLVTAVAENYQRTGLTPRISTFRNRAYVQLWNPYTIDVQGDAQLVLRNRMRVTFGNGIIDWFEDYQPTSVSVTIRPNELVVVEFENKTQSFTSPSDAVPPDPSFAANSPTNSADETTHTYFEFYWNNQLVDMSRRAPVVAPGSANAGMPRNSKTFNSGANTWQCSFIPTQSGSMPWRFVGDPRASYLSNYDWATISNDASYSSNTRWKGVQMESSPRYQNFELRWRDRDYVRVNPISGVAPGTVNTTPTAVSSLYDGFAATEKKNSPFYIRNGPMRSIGELGNIFDPAQVADDGTAPNGGSPSSPYVAGGGRTLRIGQPEFSYWDLEGKRAVQLLDLFTTSKSGTTDPLGYPQQYGQINVNTASKEVIETLFYNLKPTSDEGVITGVISQEKAQVLADRLIKIRNIAPFKRLSDVFISRETPSGKNLLQELMQETYYTPILPASDTLSNRLQLMDRAREESITKIIPLLTTTSRAFRVYIIGQALNNLGKPISTVRIEGMLELERRYVTSGGITTSYLKPKLTFLQ